MKQKNTGPTVGWLRAKNYIHKMDADVAIVGGGLAGLAASIQLADKGYSVILFEKEKYPFHKVCGEYISMEAWNFLQQLGVPLQQLKLPLINTLLLSSPNGKQFITQLPLGGFGISRHTLDHLLAQIAIQKGIAVLQQTRVNDIINDEDQFKVFFQSKEKSQENIIAKVCCAAYGKRSNIDIRWRRLFLAKQDPKINNQVAVKYHVKTVWNEQVIGLHNFPGGYCGISKVDGDKYCLCYLTTASNFKKCNNSIMQLQEKVLSCNPRLKKIFKDSEVVEEFPLTISQVSFSKKTQVEKGVLMLGDAAGMIAPLCGNGMSMALHSSKIASGLIAGFLQKKMSRKQLEEQYQQQWNKQFATRLFTGRMLQHFFGVNFFSNLFVNTFNIFPGVAPFLIKKTHGTRF
ncbi:MAG: NAD(P)/FAD-dependent oxidoreductase [Chitinophagaceae bacterium]